MEPTNAHTHKHHIKLLLSFCDLHAALFSLSFGSIMSILCAKTFWILKSFKLVWAFLHVIYRFSETMEIVWDLPTFCCVKFVLQVSLTLFSCWFYPLCFVLGRHVCFFKTFFQFWCCETHQDFTLLKAFKVLSLRFEDIFIFKLAYSKCDALVLAIPLQKKSFVCVTKNLLFLTQNELRKVGISVNGLRFTDYGLWFFCNSNLFLTIFVSRPLSLLRSFLREL